MGQAEQTARNEALKKALALLKPHYPTGVVVVGMGDANDNGEPDATIAAEVLGLETPVLTQDLPVNQVFGMVSGALTALGPAAAGAVSALVARVFGRK